MNYSDILKSFYFLNFFSKTPNNFFPVDISGSFKIEGRSIRLSSLLYSEQLDDITRSRFQTNSVTLDCTIFKCQALMNTNVIGCLCLLSLLLSRIIFWVY